jgi:hypothetical protein
MAKGYVKVDSTNLKEMLARFSEATGKSVPEIVRASARICSVELANRTQLFSAGKGGGKAKLNKYTSYLRKDILKIAKDKKSLREKAANIADAGLKVRLQAAIASGKPQAIAALLKAVGTIKDESDFKSVDTSQIGAIHKAHRSKRTGRALSTRPSFNYSENGIETYLNIVSKRLGYAKNGWAECARAIGGVKGDGARGIPAWAKRHKGNNFKVIDQSNLKQINPSITITNTTPYVSRILRPSDKSEAVAVGRLRMIKMMNAVFSALAKERKANSRSVDSITKSVTEKES